ncbi:hypothetical protein [Paraburkholderia kururiensis]|uniref:Uncharacterized protein n=1 Tax=Paraburkholderia kururiensis TaxID=984307 RepID=A0ABZ0WFN5_9BURK|nr:hypothetical protein [Paraburkholderia kururiensis]WQD76159.1 hypothetical protein U0042_18815 [Paraburkholderia kururiensis]
MKNLYNSCAMRQKIGANSAKNAFYIRIYPAEVSNPFLALPSSPAVGKNLTAFMEFSGNAPGRLSDFRSISLWPQCSHDHKRAVRSVLRRSERANVSAPGLTSQLRFRGNHERHHDQ